jgi:hypothetical protein
MQESGVSLLMARAMGFGVPPCGDGEPGVTVGDYISVGSPF